MEMESTGSSGVFVSSKKRTGNGDPKKRLSENRDAESKKRRNRSSEPLIAVPPPPP